MCLSRPLKLRQEHFEDGDSFTAQNGMIWFYLIMIGFVSIAVRGTLIPTRAWRSLDSHEEE